MADTPITNPRVGLALGGGAARGLAHIGVLAELTAANIPVDVITGTSMGSLIGAAYAAGLEVPYLMELAESTTWFDIVRPTWPRQGLVSFRKLEAFIVDVVGDLDIRDLTIPFAAIATDLETGIRVMLRKGPLARAVHASCSVPGLATPVNWHGRLLCDGGISDNLPAYPARALGADYVIGVDVFAPAFRTFLGPAGVALASLEIMVEQAGGGNQNVDCLIVPELIGRSYVRLSDHRRLIEAGAEATRAHIPRIREDLEKMAMGERATAEITPE